MARRILTIALALLCLPLLPAAPARAQAAPPQLRGLWVDSSNPGFHTPAEVDDLVENAAAGGFGEGVEDGTDRAVRKIHIEDGAVERLVADEVERFGDRCEGADGGRTQPADAAVIPACSCRAPPQ